MKNIKELGLELIELEDRVLLVTQNEMISPDDLIFESKDRLYSITESTYTNPKEYGVYKILASTVKLRKGLPLLVIEDEIENAYYEDNESKVYGEYLLPTYREGYRKAKSTYKFTEEDLRRIFIYGKQFGLTIAGTIRNGQEKPDEEIWFTGSIESLKKELFIEVELNQIKMNHKTGYEVNKVIPKILEGKIKAIWK